MGIKTGMLEMRSQLLRSILSSLGVLFGVFVMVAMLSLMGGLNTYLKEQMGEWIGSVFIWEMREPPEENMAAFSRSPGLRFSDGLYLEDEVASVEKVFKFINRREHFDIALSIINSCFHHLFHIRSFTYSFCSIALKELEQIILLLRS